MIPLLPLQHKLLLPYHTCVSSRASDLGALSLSMASSEEQPLLVERRVLVNGSAMSTYRPGARPIGVAVDARRPPRRVVLRSTDTTRAEAFDEPLERLINGVIKVASGLLLLSGSIAVGLIVRFAIHGSVPSQDDLFEEPLFTVTPTAPAYSGKQALLASLHAERTAQMKQQITFVSAVIRSQLPNHPNSDKLAATIVSESYNAHIDPLFVAAVIRSESMFSPRARSNRGARGLMQIMPDTGKYVSKQENFEWRGPHTLNDPVTNVRLGVAYLRKRGKTVRSGYTDRRFLTFL